MLRKWRPTGESRGHRGRFVGAASLHVVQSVTGPLGRSIRRDGGVHVTSTRPITNRPRPARRGAGRPHTIPPVQCPVCEVTLSISAREGVEIDFCPQCRGVWLDRGELDKVIERAGSSSAVPPAPYPERPRERDRRNADDDDDYRYRETARDHGRGRKKKRGMDFLEDLFDF